MKKTNALEGKGSGPDDDDDPADGFEDGADSQQLSDAQATVSEFIDDGEPSSGDESGQTTPVGGVEGDIESADVDDGTSDSDTLKTLDDANAPDPERLATGVRAATDSRSEFIDIRRDIMYERIDEAEDILEERLTPEEIDTVVNELQIKQEMRREYESIDAVADLEPGQDVIFDHDNPRNWETV